MSGIFSLSDLLTEYSPVSENAAEPQEQTTIVDLKKIGEFPAEIRAFSTYFQILSREYVTIESHEKQTLECDLSIRIPEGLEIHVKSALSNIYIVNDVMNGHQLFLILYNANHKKKKIKKGDIVAAVTVSKTMVINIQHE